MSFLASLRLSIPVVIKVIIVAFLFVFLMEEVQEVIMARQNRAIEEKFREHAASYGIPLVYSPTLNFANRVGNLMLSLLYLGFCIGFVYLIFYIFN